MLQPSCLGLEVSKDLHSLSFEARSLRFQGLGLRTEGFGVMLSKV